MTGAASTLGEALKLFTQCSKCETVFKLSAEVLRAAGGQVRCGNCGEVFNALASLAEDSTAFAAGESPLELETRADSILETMLPPQVAQEVAKDYEEFNAPGVEIARLEVLDWTEEDQALDENIEAQAGDAESDRAMEFTLPPGELDRIFIESKKPALVPQPEQPTAPPQPPPQPHSPPPQQPSPSPQQPAPPPQQHLPSPQQPSESPQQHSPPPQRPAPQPPSILPPVSAQHAVPVEEPAPAQQPTPPRTPVRPPGPPIHLDAEAQRPSASEPPPHPESVAAESQFVSRRVSGLEVPEDVRRDMLSEFEQRIRPASRTRNSDGRNPRRRSLILWAGAAVVSALLLSAQIMHQNREWFAAHTHGPLSAVVRGLYGALGSPLPAPANLSAYQLRQWGVTGDPQGNGTLRVRASILNTAAQLQPYPLLRVTLADRFGKNIGRRDFEPGEYLGKPTAKLMAPGERVDATLTILDPGKNAEGFEIDVCLRGVDQRISCANDVAPRPKQ